MASALRSAWADDNAELFGSLVPLFTHRSIFTKMNELMARLEPFIWLIDLKWSRKTFVAMGEMPHAQVDHY
jgi:hypothetical protein